MRNLLAFILLLTAAPAVAEVTLTNEVFVERSRADAQGRPTVVLEPPSLVAPGDRLVFVLGYRNEGVESATNFIVTNPLPAAVIFESIEGNGAEVSVDGGQNWGQLAALSVAQADGSRRSALPADVTHIRWNFSQPIAPGASGRLRFRGIVR